MNSPSDTKTIVVLGGSYGGARAAQVLATSVPQNWKIIMIDRNSHANHVYILPRLAVLSGHEHKAFIPYTKIFAEGSPHIVLQAHVKSLQPDSVVLDRAFPEHGFHSPTIPFDFSIYALGSHLPSPLDLWGSNSIGNVISPKVDAQEPSTVLQLYNGLKSEGIGWLKANQGLIRASPSILIVGGGALGVQFATDIAAVHPGKQVTLLHSRLRLLPRFDEAMHMEIMQSLEAENVQTILGERLDLSSLNEKPPKRNEQGQRVVRTVSGREIAADLLLLCTGQNPNTDILRTLDPASVDPQTSLAHVLRTMQLGRLPPSRPEDSPDSGLSIETPLELSSRGVADDLETALSKIDLSEDAGSALIEVIEESSNGVDEAITEPDYSSEDTPYPNIFVIGDAADAFGAIPAGHNAYFQGEVAARNILRLIRRAERQDDVASPGSSLDEDEPLENYNPGLPAIKVSLGMTKSVYQMNGVVGVKNDGVEDLQAASMWKYFGYTVEKDEDMYD